MCAPQQYTRGLIKLGFGWNGIKRPSRSAIVDTLICCWMMENGEDYDFYSKSNATIIGFDRKPSSSSLSSSESLLGFLTRVALRVCNVLRTPEGLLPGLDGSPTLLKPNTVLHLVLSQPSPSLLPWFTLGRWLGFGFITFEAEQSVDQAVNMHFHDIMGKKVCSCSFILPIKSSRVLGDSRSFEKISASMHQFIDFGQINRLM